MNSLISVIIPTYKRKESLERVLASIAGQDLPQSNFQIIVVDDGSPDDTYLLANKTYPFEFVYIKQQNQGAAAARNNGAEHARGDILLFLDDDITISTNFLSTFVKAHESADKIILIGNLQPAPHSEMSIFEKIYSRETSTPANQTNSEMVEVQFIDCLTGMFSVKKDHFMDIGMLQDLAKDGRVAWGDVDFGYRAYQKGFRFFRCFAAVGLHDDFSIRDWKLYAQRWQRTSQAAVNLLRTYPGIKPYLSMYFDKAPIDWRNDQAELIFKKISRQIISTKSIVNFLEKCVPLAERSNTETPLLIFLYKMIIGAYQFHGYREGITRFGPV